MISARMCFAVFCLCTYVSVAQTEMSLSNFLTRVEFSHPSLRSAEFEPSLAQADLRAALGRFDPYLDMSYEYKDISGTERLNLLNASVELPLDMLFGPRLKATYKRGAGFSLDPQNSTTAGGEGSIGFTLPVFQGIFSDTRRNQLRKAELRPELASAQYRIERNNLLRTAASRYWDWSEAMAGADVADTILVLAQRRLVQISQRARSGESARIDSVEAAQEVQRRIGERFKAIRLLELIEIDLATYLWNGDGTPVVMNGSRPVALNSERDTSVSVLEASNTARKSRPELIRVDVLQRTAQLDSGFANELLRPMVEFEGALVSYDVGQSMPGDYRLGLRINQPLLFRQASGTVQTASIAVRRAELARTLAERLVDADASASIIALDRARQRREAADEEVRLAQFMVVAEQRRFDAGDATLLQINLRERFYAEALQRLISARAEWAKAKITLRWATGTL